MGRSATAITVAFCLCLLLAASSQAAPLYVINISVDGLGSSYLQSLVDASQVPNFQRFQLEGAWTNNARNDYDITVTLPNHVTMVTGRGIQGTTGHNWTSNSDPAANQTLHTNKGSYVASVFDVAHDSGLRTGMFATKTKFSLFNTSYNATNGAVDATGADDGRDKLDVYTYNSSSSVLTTALVSAMNSDPFHYSFVHFTDGDTAGHSSGWGSTAYNNAIKAVDGYLGSIFNLVETNPALQGHTTIILTADHGGSGYDHSNASDPLNYTIPFYVWGLDVPAGVDLYAINASTRLNPGTGRPNYAAAVQPIRNGELANLSLDLLGLEPVTGSTLNSTQNLAVPEPATVVVLLTAILLLVPTWGRGRRPQY